MRAAQSASTMFTSSASVVGSTIRALSPIRGMLLTTMEEKPCEGARTVEDEDSVSPRHLRLTVSVAFYAKRLAIVSKSMSSRRQAARGSPALPDWLLWLILLVLMVAPWLTMWAGSPTSTRQQKGML